MIKKILFFGFLCFSFHLHAQEGTASPYSFYGIGDVRFRGNQEIRSMGGVGIMQDSIHMNIENPASYGSLKQTTFSMSGTYNTLELKTNTKAENAKRVTLDYLAVGLPLGKFGVGFGLIPYSSVGYQITAPADNTFSEKKFTGKGGLNKVFAGVGYKITKEWSVGADFNYNFGTIEALRTEGFLNIPNQTNESNTSLLSGFNFNVASLYQKKIDAKKTFYSAFNIGFASKINSDNSRIQLTDNDSIVILSNSNTVLKIPTKITVGVGIGEAKKWLIGGQLSYRDAGILANTYNNKSNVSYGRYGTVSLGGYFIPDYKSFTSYFKRINYRAGIRYEKTGLVINNQSINDLSFTVGLGLPAQFFSNFNLGFEIGKRGTTNTNLVQENYANLSIGFSFNDKWFVKRKYN